MTLFLKIATCPRCITLLRRLLPTVQVMDGETGEDFASDFEAHLYEKWYGEWSGEWCPAPTPRAP